MHDYDSTLIRVTTRDGEDLIVTEAEMLRLVIEGRVGDVRPNPADVISL